MTPLLRAMKSVLGPHPLLEYLDSFRYPLAGECSMTTDLARINRIPSDWGLEVGVLAEVLPQLLAEADLPGRAGRELRPQAPRALRERRRRSGLHRMVVDIASSLIRNLASYGVQFDAGFLNTLIAAYVRTAQDAIARYSDDAALNGLVFDRHEEEVAVETFSRALRAAGPRLRARPDGRAADPELEPRDLGAARPPRRAARGRRGGSPTGGRSAIVAGALVKIGGVALGDGAPLVLIAGLNVIESEAETLDVARLLRESPRATTCRSCSRRRSTRRTARASARSAGPASTRACASWRA